jgi:hypothetical protein
MTLRRRSDPGKLLPPAPNLASFIPLVRAGSHWVIAAPFSPLEALVRLDQVEDCLGPGDRAGLLPVPGTGMTAVVVALDKATVGARDVLTTLGFRDPFELNRLEEQLAAGHDLLALAADKALAEAALDAVAEAVTAPLPPPRPRPRLRQIRRFRRRRPGYAEYARRHLPRGMLSATMNKGQWDPFLAEVYAGGGQLVELDDRERVVAVYCKEKETR